MFYNLLETPTFDDNGIPHAIEHLVFLHSDNEPNCNQVDEFAAHRLCTNVNASTYDDHTK